MYNLVSLVFTVNQVNVHNRGPKYIFVTSFVRQHQRQGPLALEVGENVPCIYADYCSFSGQIFETNSMSNTPKEWMGIKDRPM